MLIVTFCSVALDLTTTIVIFVHQWHIRNKDLRITYWVHLGHWSVGMQDALHINKATRISVPSLQVNIIC